jgi:hypothetical protein
MRCSAAAASSPGSARCRRCRRACATPAPRGGAASPRRCDASPARQEEASYPAPRPPGSRQWLPRSNPAAAPDLRAAAKRVRVKILGSQKCRVVGKSQTVLIMTNPIIFTRTRSSTAATAASQRCRRQGGGCWLLSPSTLTDVGQPPCRLRHRISQHLTHCPAHTAAIATAAAARAPLGGRERGVGARSHRDQRLLQHLPELPLQPHPRRPVAQPTPPPARPGSCPRRRPLRRSRASLMKPKSRVTGIPLQFHSCYLRLLSCIGSNDRFI